MTDAITLPDRRAPAFPDEPFSAYCKACWNAVYVLWVDKAHNPDGKCPNGCADPGKCPDAIAAAKESAGVLKFIRDCEKPVSPTPPNTGGE